MAHAQTANTKITSIGNRFSSPKVPPVISLYPHEAGNAFPIVSSIWGSISAGNIIPESMIEGRKTIMENMEVFVWSFTARPIMLAMPSDTAIKMEREAKYTPGFSGILASKARGAAIYRIMLIINRWINAEILANAIPR